MINVRQGISAHDAGAGQLKVGWKEYEFGRQSDLAKGVNLMSDAYTEPYDKIGCETQDIVRAMKSLREELEATDYYHQRAQTTQDPELKKIFEHNRDEEKEHAVMLVEWLRRNMDGWDKELKEYIFTDAPITEIENSGAEEQEKSSGEGLGLGKLL